MIPPHGLEITYDKTVHVIFPSSVKYVDLGSPNLIAGIVRVVSWPSEERWSLAEGQLLGLSSPY